MADAASSSPVWRVSGLVWAKGRSVLGWVAPDGRGERSSALPTGLDLAFTVGADRRCVGLWRGGRRRRCPTTAPLDPAAHSGQCAACSGLDRSYSIAADTRPDDPRPFAVYLAHHGDALVKVGITAVERGMARLLEQGAFASTVLSTGTLASARRCEHLLGTALGVPDRVATGRKRAARTRPATPAGRAADLLAVAERARQLPWPEGQIRHETRITDHCATYDLPESGLRPAAQVLPLVPGASVVGTVVCRVGIDLYLSTAAGLVLLDTRLLSGWALSRAAPDAALTAALRKLNDQQSEQDPLF